MRGGDQSIGIARTSKNTHAHTRNEESTYEHELYEWRRENKIQANISTYIYKRDRDYLMQKKYI